MHVLVLGHSFVTRLDHYLRQKNITMPPNQITCLGQGGCYLSGLKFTCLMNEAHMFLAANQCQLLYIALGTNDLDAGLPPAKVAQQLWFLARRLQIMYNIRYVFIEQILNRSPLIYPGFKAKARQANAQVQAYINQGNSPHIKYWKHSKMDSPKKPILDGKGVHLNEAGMHKYWRSVRGAIAFAEARMS